MNKWQEGKRYKLKSETLKKFIDENATNKRLVDTIGDEVFTVKTVSDTGRVVELVEHSADPLDLCYWFSQSEINFFEIVETSNEDTIIDSFLDKLQYVLLTDSSVGDNVSTSGHSGVLNIETDHGTIYGVPSIRSFITNRYNQLQQEFNHKKNNELLKRKAKLEAELAEVNKELGNG